jgi:hypothetical protein
MTEENEEHEEIEATTVTVEIPTEEVAPEVVDNSDTVVVVTTPPTTTPVSDPVMDRLMTMDQRFNELMEVVEHQNLAIAQLAGSQSTTAEIVAEEQTARIEAELAETDTEDEIVPETRHAWFRPISSWIK